MMKIIILGGGISGLSAAWYAKKRYPEAHIQLFEATDRLGGVIDTGCLDDLIYEKGPRTFVRSRSPHFLELIKDLDLSLEILPCSPLAKKRYLWHRGKLKSISSLLWPFLPVLIREPFTAKKVLEDESIYDFALRKFNHKVAMTFFDPMALGIFAESAKKLSLRSCFPIFQNWEKQGISLLRGLFSSMVKKKEGGLFTLKRGLISLIDEIKKRLSIEIFYQTPVTEMTPHGIMAGGSFFTADMIVSALPGHVLGRLSGCWPDFKATSLWVVQVAFKEDVLKQQGFGYLIPSEEKEAILGVVWDSSLFQRQSQNCQTLLTVMVRASGDASWAEKEVLSALERHLKIRQKPFFVHAYLAKDAIPHLEVGYAKRLDSFLQDLKTKYPRLHVCGNYLEGVSIDSCVYSSKKIFIN